MTIFCGLMTAFFLFWGVAVAFGAMRPTMDWPDLSICFGPASMFLLFTWAQVQSRGLREKAKWSFASFVALLYAISIGVFIYARMHGFEVSDKAVPAVLWIVPIGWIYLVAQRPKVRSEDAKKKAGEPGATDNPDDAQRLREDC